MDFGTTVTPTQQDIDIPATPDKLEPILRPSKQRQASTSVTVGKGILAEGESVTNALPEIIWANWGLLSRMNVRGRMFGDLVRLASAPDGWNGAGSRSLRPESLKAFLMFWSSIHDHAAEPELTLAPDGSVHAEWFESPRKRLDVRFGSHGAFFGLFVNNRIVEGVDSTRTVAQLLSLHPSKPLSRSAR
jgi:hypothetical protein